MTQAPLSAVFVGSDTLLRQCVQVWRQRGHAVAAIVTDSDAVRRFAQEQEVQCRDARDLETAARELRCDYLFAVTWLRLLPEAALAWPSRLPINFHDGPLPRYAGLNAPCWAILHGEREHGVTWHVIETEADAGAILVQQRFPVADDDTAFTLNARCFQAGQETFAQLCDRIAEGTLVAVPQDRSQRTWFGRGQRPPHLGVVDWRCDPAEIVRLVRAFEHGGYPNPVGVAKLWLGETALVPGSAVVAAGSGARPGTVTRVEADRVQIAANGGDVVFAGLRTLDHRRVGRNVDAAALAALGLRVGTVLPQLDGDGERALAALAQDTARGERAWVRALSGLEPLPVPGAPPAVAGGNAARNVAPIVAPIAAPNVAPNVAPIVVPGHVSIALPGERTQAEGAALCLAFLARMLALRGDLGLWGAHGEAGSGPAAALRLEPVPFRLDVDGNAPARDVLAQLQRALEEVRSRGPLLRELFVRHPVLRALDPLLPLDGSLPLGVALGSAATAGAPAGIDVPGIRAGIAANVGAGTVTFAVAADGTVQLAFDTHALPRARAEQWAAWLQRFAAALRRDPTVRFCELPLLALEEIRALLAAGRGAPAPPLPAGGVHRQFAPVAAANPDRVAVHAGETTQTYGQLAAAVEHLAARLAALGVGRGDRVGLCLRRSAWLPAAVLAVLRAGAAYVPLDPGYPDDRLQFMANDSGLAVLVVDRDSRAHAPHAGAPVLVVDANYRTAVATPPPDDATGVDLAYVIYTSGSTGRPKGVMVGHDNVANFFAGMDAVLADDMQSGGTWLAVTSLSFDISVLELLWTLCRGFTVVVHPNEGRTAPAATTATAVALPASQSAPSCAPASTPSSAPSSTASSHLSFSLFYFASDAGEHGSERYRLLLDGARFADQHGFEAVWTPERHFHAFGGLYPNPALASAALAAITERVHLRAGSCVSPLHSPIRIAEDWALVDNLSGGRVGISFAAGWQPNDFVLAPQNFAARKQKMFDDLRTVQALWRGETVAFPGHDGAPVEVRTLPRPVQPTLPTWVTVAGNPETYQQAGEAGAFVLTHLLGQSVSELRGKLQAYRQAWQQAGHAGAPKVTLMLHTFVGASDEEVRATVKEPMRAYLRSSVDLIRQAAWSFPAFQQRTGGRTAGEADAMLQGGLSDTDMDALLDFAFERYYAVSGLFGTVDTCLEMLARVRAIGVDEVACLIDFGVPSATVLAHLPQLLQLKQRSDAADLGGAVVPMREGIPASAADDGRSGGRSDAGPPLPTSATSSREPTMPELIERHGVTHLQCTPSMAAMLLVDPQSEGALRRLRYMLVGGEALPSPLARRLRALVPNLHDMYGPTETTVWSTSWRVGDDDPVPIGRPLCGQTVYVLDAHRQLAPFGEVGELWIGGAGVARGYHGRGELTAERFVADPFAGHGRMYRTGDLARWQKDGALEYLGRADFQVKVRGHRIELGEIEAVLGKHAGVREAAVVARHAAGGEMRLCAYVAGGAALSLDELRAHVRARLPEFMVPQHFVALPELPRTPNQKIDRRALPAPEAVATAAVRPRAAAGDGVEAAILGIWKDALGTQDVGVEDNFFDSGGHSILAVQVHRRVQESLGVALQVTDLFRFTTVRALAQHVAGLQQGAAAPPTAAQMAMERAKARRDLLRRR